MQESARARPPMRADGARNLDFTLSKKTVPHERHALQFLECFNIFNTPRFRIPGHAAICVRSMRSPEPPSISSATMRRPLDDHHRFGLRRHYNPARRPGEPERYRSASRARTAIAVSPDGYITQIVNPNQEPVELTYG